MQKDDFFCIKRVFYEEKRTILKLNVLLQKKFTNNLQNKN